MMSNQTREKQYQSQFEQKESIGWVPMGMKTGHTWKIDPKRLIFSLSRYKFAAKLLSGKEKVLEVGCGDGWCSRIVKQEVDYLLATDFDPIFIEDAIERKNEDLPIEYRTHDILKHPLSQKFNAAFSLDVIEHIAPEKTDIFLRNIVLSLKKPGVLLIGQPSLNSQVYASENSRIGHINCMNSDTLKEVTSKYFSEVFIFSMNDEVVHTGFYPMSHYLFALCIGTKI